MDNLKHVEVVVLKDSPLSFGGESVYTRGELYRGVLDINTNVALVAFRTGNQFIKIDEAEDLYFNILDDFKPSSDDKIKSIESYLKSISILRWINKNVAGKFNIYEVQPLANMGLLNAVGNKNGGFERLSPRMNLLGVTHKDNEDDLMVQVRKGSIFYIDNPRPGIAIKPKSLNSLSYEELKEVKFIVENDYKHSK